VTRVYKTIICLCAHLIQGIALWVTISHNGRLVDFYVVKKPKKEGNRRFL
jgi:hypothetical protein